MLKMAHLALGFSLLIPSLMVPAAARADSHYFTLYNDTSYQIDSVYVRPTGDDNDADWSNDLLDNAVLGANDNIEFTIDNANGCNWDIKITYHDSKDDEGLSNIDLCTDSDVKIWYDYGNNQFNYQSW